MRGQHRITKIMIGVGLMAALVMANSLPGFARDKYETIEAQAMGTGTQMGEATASCRGANRDESRRDLDPPGRLGIVHCPAAG